MGKWSSVLLHEQERAGVMVVVEHRRIIKERNKMTNKLSLHHVVVQSLTRDRERDKRRH